MHRLYVTMFLLFAAGATAGAQSVSSGSAGAGPSPDAQAPAGLVPQPGFISHGIDRAASLQGAVGADHDGFYPELHNMVTGAGWITLGPGYRRHLFGGRALIDGSAALSWRAYKMAQARFELPSLAHRRVTVGAAVRWQDYTQVNYFGIGSAAPESGRSEYRLEATDVVGYTSVRPADWLAIGARVERVTRPTLSPPTGPFDAGRPNALASFPLDPGVANPAGYVHGDVSIAADTRDYPDHPTAGALYRAAAVEYWDSSSGLFDFRTYEAEGLQIIPVVDRRWVIAVHAWTVFSDVAANHQVPFYLLPSLGGQNTLRGYNNYRFHDRDLLVANVESRWALLRNVDVAAFADAGNVAPRFGDLSLDKRSYGVGIRAHARRATLVGVDVGHSREGWHLFFKLDDPFVLSRLSRKAASLPIVP